MLSVVFFKREDTAETPIPALCLQTAAQPVSDCKCGNCDSVEKNDFFSAKSHISGLRKLRMGIIFAM